MALWTNDGGIDKAKTEAQLQTEFESVTGAELEYIYRTPAEVGAQNIPVIYPTALNAYENSTRKKLYTKVFSGTLPVDAASQRSVVITHGLTDTKIVGVKAMVKNDCATSAWIGLIPANLPYATTANVDNYITFAHTGATFALSNWSLSGLSGKPYKVIVDYTE